MKHVDIKFLCVLLGGFTSDSRIMLQHLSGRASIEEQIKREKRRKEGERRREKKREGKKERRRRGKKKEEGKEKGEERKRRKEDRRLERKRKKGEKRRSTGNQTCDSLLSIQCSNYCAVHRRPNIARTTVEPLYNGHHWGMKFCPL